MPSSRGPFDDQELGRFQHAGDDQVQEDYDDHFEEEGGEEGEEDIEDAEGTYERGEGPLGAAAASLSDALDAARKYQDLATRRQKIAQRALTRARKESKAAAAEKREADAFVARLERRVRGEEKSEYSSSNPPIVGVAASEGNVMVATVSAHDPNVKRTRMRFDVQFKQKAILEYEELKQMHAGMGEQYQQKTYCEEKMGGFNQGMLSRWLKARDQILAAANATAEEPVKSIHKKDGSGKKKRKRRKTENPTKREKAAV